MESAVVSPSDKKKYFGLKSATALVVANIIGAGIFTTTGFQAADLGHPLYILLLWVVGGGLAFCGALCYAELGSMMPEEGGEYAYLRQTYGVMFGFMSAFVSLIAGFPAPIASVAKGLGHYLGFFFPVLGENPKILGIVDAVDLFSIAFIWFLIWAHMRSTEKGIKFNNIITLMKISGIALIILAAFSLGNGDINNLTMVSESYKSADNWSRFSAFGTSLIFVMFCYSGWNASAYVANEIENPQKNLPKSLLYGTLVVLVLYLGLNLVYFYGADVNILAGKVEVGLIASGQLFGQAGVTFVVIVLAISLVASASAMTIAGPRVYHALGRDSKTFYFLAKTDKKSGAPVNALLLQGVVTTVIILSGSVDEIQQYAGFTLTLFSTLAVFAVIVLRIKDPHRLRPFRVWGYPFTPVIFIVASLWMMFWALQGRPVESMVSLLTVVAGGIIFYLTEYKSPDKQERSLPEQ